MHGTLVEYNCVWLKLWYDVFVVTVFLAEQFKGKIPVPPIQELFELEPNVLSKRWDRMITYTFISLQFWGRAYQNIPADIGYDSEME